MLDINVQQYNKEDKQKGVAAKRQKKDTLKVEYEEDRQGYQVKDGEKTC